MISLAHMPTFPHSVRLLVRSNLIIALFNWSVLCVLIISFLLQEFISQSGFIYIFFMLPRNFKFLILEKERYCNLGQETILEVKN